MKNAVTGNVSTTYYTGKLAFKVFRFFFMVLMTFVILYPLLYMVSMAFRPSEDVYNLTVVWIPTHFSVESFQLLFKEFGVVAPLWNTCWISLVCSVIQVLIVSITAYGFSRFKFPFKNLLFVLLIFSIVVPPQMYSMPTYLSFSNFDLFGIFKTFTGDTVSLLGKPGIFPVLALLGQGIRSSLFILIMRQYYTALPAELEEAALIDGCGYFRCYRSIIFPSGMTQMFVIFLFSVVWYWNDYYFSSIYLGGSSTFAVKLSNIRAMLENVATIQSHNSYEIAIYEQAGCLLLIVPLVILYIFTQRYFVEGLEKTGLVG